MTALYAYRAAQVSGRIRKGKMTATSEKELAFLLRQMELELIEARPAPRPSASWDKIRSRGAQDGKQAFLLCGQTAALLRAGVPLLETLELVRAETPAGPWASALTSIAQKVRGGASVFEAFSRQDAFFDPVVLALLQAGETSGDLAAAFEGLADHLRRREKIRRDLRRAVRYPLFLGAIAFAVTSFMMAYVVPEIVSFLTNLGIALPFATRLLIKGASLFAGLWWTLPLLVAGAGLGLWAARRQSERAALATDRALLSLPFLGPVLSKLARARFAAGLPLLLKSGLGPPQALEAAGKTLGNRYLARLAQEAAAAVTSGTSFSQAVAPLLAPLAVRMIRVGEKSGTLPETLEEIARQDEAEAHEAVDAFLGGLEPALTILIGLLLAWIVLAVLGPLYGSLGALSGGGV